jgi:hypothetical protein
MATFRIISKKEQIAEMRARFRVVCVGVPKDDFASLVNAFQKDFGCKVALRNPFPPEFDPKAIHELIAHVTGSAIGGYAAKKSIDAAKELFVAFIKYKFMSNEGKNPRKIKLLYGPNDKVLCQVKNRGKKRRS